MYVRQGSDLSDVITNICHMSATVAVASMYSYITASQHRCLHRSDQGYLQTHANSLCVELNESSWFSF